MIIAVAGPYSAKTEELKQTNLDAMNSIAAQLLSGGHTPVIGVNAALPIVDKANLRGAERYKAIMDISMAVVDNCDALLLIGESPGANRERDLILSKGHPVYYDLKEIPDML